MKRKVFVPFRVIMPMFLFVLLPIMIFVAYKTWDDIAGKIIGPIVVLMDAVAAISVLYSCSGNIIIKEQSIVFKEKWFKQEVVISKYGIKKIFVNVEDFGDRDGGLTMRADSATGPIIGRGAHCLRALVSDLKIPVKVKEPDIHLLSYFVFIFLLKKGQLTKNSANRLKEYFHIPQKLFDKWYVEPKQ